MNLANFVTARRRERGLSIRAAEAASHGWVKANSICDIEAGSSVNISAKMILGLAKALKVKPEIILAAISESLKEPTA